MLNIAHRGASGTHPENTLSAFRAAAECGADMCELDVRKTYDSAIVAIHDDTLDRTTDGKGAVSAKRLVEVKKFDAGATFDKRFRGERIPTLEQVFAAVHPRCGLNIELKVKGAERRVCEIIEANEAAGTSMVSSFEWDTLRRVREINSAIRLGVLSEKNPQKMLETAIAMRAWAVNPRFDRATPDLIAAAHLKRLRVLVWTVDDPDVMRMLAASGVDGIMTNYPERLKQALAG